MDHNKCGLLCRCLQHDCEIRQTRLVTWDSNALQAAVQQWLPLTGFDNLKLITESPKAKQLKVHADSALQRCSSWKHSAMFRTGASATDV